MEFSKARLSFKLHIYQSLTYYNKFQLYQQVLQKDLTCNWSGFSNFFHILNLISVISQAKSILF